MCPQTLLCNSLRLCGVLLLEPGIEHIAVPEPQLGPGRLLLLDVGNGVGLPYDLNEPHTIACGQAAIGEESAGEGGREGGRERERERGRERGRREGGREEGREEGGREGGREEGREEGGQGQPCSSARV